LKAGAVKERSSLRSIQIKNLGVIQSANIDFAEGLTVLTGETGAGKTMVLTALSLILGGKADQNLVRVGSDRLIVAAEFSATKEIADLIAEFGAELDEQKLLITRTVTSDGKSKAAINGLPVTNATLSQIGEHLVEIHAQSSSARLNKESVQRELLDSYAQNSVEFASYQKIYEEYKELIERITQFEASLKTRDSEIARLKEISELVKKYDLQEDVFNNISDEITRLESVEDINKAVAGALDVLANDEFPALSALAAAAKLLQGGQGLDKELKLFADQFASELSNYQSGLNADPARFDYLQNRKAELLSVFKKYGKGDDKNLAINEIVLESNSAKSRIEDLSGGQDRLAQLNNERMEKLNALTNAARLLSVTRQTAAKKISAEITSELTELALANSIVEVDVSAGSMDKFSSFHSYGIDSVVFNFASHKSAKLAPLAKSASGGELSRVMLAIEVVLSKNASIGTYIFDEVDAGVGGKAAIEVGRKLASVAKTSQVIVVSHLAQVAVWAQNHLVVEKSDQGDFIESSVSGVEGERRKVEVARLLSGQEGSDSAREHAAELLELAGN
jgi:DNA repair protein RecN (Recombination protein N)